MAVSRSSSTNRIFRPIAPPDGASPNNSGRPEEANPCSAHWGGESSHALHGSSSVPSAVVRPAQQGVRAGRTVERRGSAQPAFLVVLAASFADLAVDFGALAILALLLALAAFVAGVAVVAARAGAAIMLNAAKVAMMIRFISKSPCVGLFVSRSGRTRDWLISFACRAD